MSPNDAKTNECGASKTALLPSAKLKCAGEKDETIELESNNSTVATILSMDSKLDRCNIHSIDLENNIGLHIDLEDENIMIKDFFVSEINSEHKDTNGRAHFDNGSQMTTTNQKDLLFGYKEYDNKHPCKI